MIEIILCACWSALFLIIWFETDAFVHYCELLRLDFAFGIVEYKNSMLYEGMDYLDYLRIKYPNSFVIKLITCQLCLSIWFSAAFVLGSSMSFIMIAPVELLAISFYFIIKKLFN